MAAVGQQHEISLLQDAAFEIVLVIVVEIDPNLARLDEQDFFCVVHLPCHGIVHMRRDDIALGRFMYPNCWEKSFGVKNWMPSAE